MREKELVAGSFVDVNNNDDSLEKYFIEKCHCLIVETCVCLLEHITN
jgi:hypothetical protein